MNLTAIWTTAQVTLTSVGLSVLGAIVLYITSWAAGSSVLRSVWCRKA
jgi:hypothetical protein